MRKITISVNFWGKKIAVSHTDTANNYLSFHTERLAYTEENIRDIVKDEGAEIYYVEEEHVCPGFWPSGMER